MSRSWRHDDDRDEYSKPEYHMTDEEYYASLPVSVSYEARDGSGLEEVGRYKTVAEAEQFIADIESNGDEDAEDVRAGRYSIDNDEDR